MKQSKNKLDWGEIANFLPTDLLNLTNISEFVDQQSIERLNSNLETLPNGNKRSLFDNKEQYFQTRKHSVDGDNKYDFHIRTKTGAYIFPANNEMCGEHTSASFDLHLNGFYQIIDTKIVKNKYGTWKSLNIRVFDESTPWGEYDNTFRDPQLLIVQDYDGGIKFFRGKKCLVKITEKRFSLAKIKEQNSPVNMISQEREE